MKLTMCVCLGLALLAGCVEEPRSVGEQVSPVKAVAPVSCTMYCVNSYVDKNDDIVFLSEYRWMDLDNSCGAGTYCSSNGGCDACGDGAVSSNACPGSCVASN